MDLTDEQWSLIAPLLPKHPQRADGRGRRWLEDRPLLNGVLWILRTGAQWEDLPRRYGSPATCHRRFQSWQQAGVMESILMRLATDLEERGGIDVSECFIDATFAPAKKGAQASERPSVVKAARSWQLQTALVFLSPYAQKVLVRMKSPS